MDFFINKNKKNIKIQLQLLFLKGARPNGVGQMREEMRWKILNTIVNSRECVCLMSVCVYTGSFKLL